jgi:hypothetical protein
VRLLSWPFARRGSSYAPSSLGCSGGSTRNGASRAHQVCLPVAYKQVGLPRLPSLYASEAAVRSGRSEPGARGRRGMIASSAGRLKQLLGVETEKDFVELFSSAVCEGAVLSDATKPAFLENALRADVVMGRARLDGACSFDAREKLREGARGDGFAPMFAAEQYVTSRSPSFVQLAIEPTTLRSTSMTSAVMSSLSRERRQRSSKASRLLGSGDVNAACGSLQDPSNAQRGRRGPSLSPLGEAPRANPRSSPPRPTDSPGIRATS